MKIDIMLILILTLSLVIISANAFTLNLTKDGKVNAVIVVSEDAIESEKTAGKELASYLEKISGAKLEIINKPIKDKINIFVGQNQFLDEKLNTSYLKNIKSDGIMIKSGKDFLILTGDRPRGTLYAVYTFLEDYLGCRFWNYDSEFVPTNKDIKVDNNINFIYNPPFFSREAYYGANVNNPNFAVKRKLNGHYNKIPEDLGGYIELIGFVHTFSSLIPEALYFEKHPEWFNLIDGKRIAGHTQLCLSNQELLEELAKRTINILDNHPNPKMISVSQNDASIFCQCENCSELTKKFGSHSGLMIYAINFVAEKVKEKYPDVMVETLAYQYTVPPPTAIKPAENVIIRLCDIENNFGEPLSERSKNTPYKIIENCRIFPYANQQTVNKEFVENLEKWSKISDNMFIWDYTVNFNNYHIIHPNFQSLKSNMNLFKDNNVKAVFEQGDVFNYSPAFNNLKSYLISKLLWNPSVDDKATMKEFLNGYYGQAGNYLYDILMICEEVIKSKKIFLSTYMNDSSWLSAEEMTEIFKLFNLGISAVSEDKILRDRVLIEMYSFQMGWYLADPDTQKQVSSSGYLHHTDPEKFATFYYNFSKEHRNGYYSESRSMDYSILAPEKPPEKTRNVPKECINLTHEEWIELQDTDFDLKADEKLIKRISDEKASNKTSTVMTLNNVEWSLSRNFTKTINMLASDGVKSLDIYITCKIEGKPTDEETGQVLTFAIWDTENGGIIFPKSIDSKDLINGEYVTIYVGEMNILPTRGALLYFAPTNRGLEEVLYIDRVIGIKKK